MLTLLHSHVNAPLGTAVMIDLVRLGLHGCRVDLTDARDEVAEECLIEVRAHGLTPLAVIRDSAQLYRLGKAFPQALWELENEPEIANQRRGAIAARDYRDMVVDAALVARACPARPRLYVGAIANPTISEGHDRGLNYLAQVMPALAEFPEVGVTLHWYRAGRGQEWHRGFASLEAQVRAFRNVIGLDRHWAVSATGDHTARETWTTGRWWWQRTHTERFSDEEVAERAAARLQFFAEQGAAFVAWYQYKDGPSFCARDCYGIHRYSGQRNWKPVAYRLGFGHGEPVYRAEHGA